MIDLAKSGIRRLVDEYNVRLDPISDLTVISNILRLAEKAYAAGADWQSRALLRPAIQVGSLNLQRLSIGAQEFLRQVNDWFPDDERILNLSLAFLMANRNNLAAVWGIQDGGSWRRMIRSWSRTIDCDYLELLRGIAAFQDRHESDLAALGKTKTRKESDDLAPDQDSAGRFGPIVEILCSEYGKDPETWIWQTPIEEIELLLDAFVERQESQARKTRTKEGHHRAVAPDPDRPAIAWMRRFQMYVDQVGKERGKKKCPGN